MRELIKFTFYILFSPTKLFSSVHDPESPGGAQGSTATLGDLSGLEKMVKEKLPFDMVDGGDYDADKAYKDSKVN